MRAGPDDDENHLSRRPGPVFSGDAATTGEPGCPAGELTGEQWW
ncbi:hypothetical protein [Streptomyces cyanogenus]|nr:hypothetical protein [Streptomyces cyanogenus]